MIYLELTDSRIREFNLLRQYLIDNNIAYDISFPKKIERGIQTIGTNDIADGTIRFIYAILMKNGKHIPIIDSYPEELHPYLYRKIRKTQLMHVNEWYTGFIKPAYALKLFTGFVIDDASDHYALKCHSKYTEVYLSEIVSFKTEWRYYVIGKEIVAQGNYDGDENLICDLNIVQEAINKVKNPPSAFCIDFGVLESGETALVEYNDAFSVGWYLDDKIDIYFNLIATRFEELMM